MNKALSTTLIVLGILSILGSSLNARNAPNPSYFLRTFLPGVAFLIIGMALRREKAPVVPEPSPVDALERAGVAKEEQSNRFKTRASIGVGGGIVTMILGSGLAQQGPDSLMAGIAISLCGWALVIWGCVNYMRWKGYSGWLGLFGYLLLPGLIILACFSNRRIRMLQNEDSEHLAEMEALALEDRRSGSRFLWMLVPLGVVFVSFGGLLSSARSNIDPAGWKELAPPGLGFRALMPGTPQLEQTTHETPAGELKLHKFTVEPKGKKELFMIVTARFPEDTANQLGGREKLLELGRKDLLAASQGRLQSERPIVLGNLPGLELEVLPPEGAIIKARIFATKNQIYQVSVHVPKIRLTSKDVQKYLDSFSLLAQPGAAPDTGGK